MAKWLLEYELDEFPGCCGIGTLHHLRFEESDEQTRRYDAFGNYHDSPRGFRNKLAAVKSATSFAKREYVRTLAAIPDQRAWKEMLDLFLQAGWKELGTSRSRMSRSYQIHLLAIDRPLRKRKVKQGAV